MNKSYLLLISIVMVMLVSSLTKNQSPQVYVTPNDESVRLERSFSSAVMLKLVHHRKGGTGVLVGKKKAGDNGWRYNVLTACHVVEEFIPRARDGMSIEEIEQTKRLVIAVYGGFHNKPVLCESKLLNLEWVAPEKDWAIFSCYLPYDLPCAELATRKDFESIRPYEHIFGIAGDDLRGLSCKTGILSSTSNDEPYSNQASAIIVPWDKFSHEFFRPDHNIWFGASGGPIFKKDGKLIGIYIALTIRESQAIPHSIVAYKAHCIRETIENSQPQLIREDYELK